MPAFAGNTIRAGDDFSAWTPFTPTFQGVTLGAGEIAGFWRRAGTFSIDVHAYFRFGTGSAVTTLGLTLPGGLSGDGSAMPQTLSACAFDSSANTGYAGFCKLADGGGTLMDRCYGPSSLAWAAAVPFTWAANDWLLIEGNIRTLS